MIPKKDCTKTICPLCEKKCQAGSTNSGFIENNGACLSCIFGKSKEEVEALLLAKKESGYISPSIESKDATLVIKEVSKFGYSDNEIQVALCSDDEIYFKKADVAGCLTLSRVGLINSYRRSMGSEASVLIMAESSDGWKHPTAFISKNQLIRYLEKRKCFYSKKMLHWVNENTFFTKPLAENKAGIYVGVDLSKQRDKGAIAVIAITKSDCTENTATVELDGIEFNENHSCHAYQHERNNAENERKSPAIFHGVGIGDSFLKINKNGLDEVVTVKKTWQKIDNSCWVTFTSNLQLGFLDMKLLDFVYKFKNKLIGDENKNFLKGANAPASDERRFFYITFSYFIGGKRGHRKGFISHRTSNNEFFNIQAVSEKIKESLNKNKINTKGILIESWQEVNKNEYAQLMKEEI